MDTPADTWNYFFAGYAVIFITIAAYLINLAVRWHRLKQEQAALKEKQ